MLTVKALADGGTPAPIATCRAGACPSPAARTLPTITSSTAAGSTPAPARARRSCPRDRPQFRRRPARQPPQITPDRRPAGRQDQRLCSGHDRLPARIRELNTPRIGWTYWDSKTETRRGQRRRLAGSAPRSSHRSRRALKSSVHWCGRVRSDRIGSLVHPRSHDSPIDQRVPAGHQRASVACHWTSQIERETVMDRESPRSASDPGVADDALAAGAAARIRKHRGGSRSYPGRLAHLLMLAGITTGMLPPPPGPFDLSLVIAGGIVFWPRARERRRLGPEAVPEGTPLRHEVP